MSNGSEHMKPTDGKRDILEFDLGEVSVPQAIALMMQAATKCVHHGMNHEDPLLTDDDRLAQLTEKLEAFVEDELEKGVSPTQPAATDEPDLFESAEPSDTFLQKNDEGDIVRVTHKGVVFGLLCNERVNTDPTTGEQFNCIKEWGHDKAGNPEHENVWGDVR